MITVRDVLRAKEARVVAIRLNETVAAAAALMKREKTNTLIVKDVCWTEGDTVIGSLSALEIAAVLAERGSDACKLRVADIVDRPLISSRPNHTIEMALKLMGDHQLWILPVIDDGALIGSVAARELIHALCRESAVGHDKVDA